MTLYADVRLPDNIEQNAVGGPTFNTTVIALASGTENRNQNWMRQRMTYEISYGIQDYEDYVNVLAFFYARAGRLVGFRFKDWSDYIATGQPLSPDSTGLIYQCQKTYPDPALPYTRIITRPVAETVVVYVGGVATTAWTFQDGSGSIVFAAAPDGAVTADFEFDVPVRFDSDEMSLTAPTDLAASVGSLKLIEVRE